MVEEATLRKARWLVLSRTHLKASKAHCQNSRPTHLFYPFVERRANPTPTRAARREPTRRVGVLGLGTRWATNAPAFSVAISLFKKSMALARLALSHCTTRRGCSKSSQDHTFWSRHQSSPRLTPRGRSPMGFVMVCGHLYILKLEHTVHARLPHLFSPPWRGNLGLGQACNLSGGPFVLLHVRAQILAVWLLGS